MSDKQILVVEDDPKIAETLVHLLNAQGFEATRVVTILEAAEESNAPSIVQPRRGGGRLPF